MARHFPMARAETEGRAFRRQALSDAPVETFSDKKWKPHYPESPLKTQKKRANWQQKIISWPRIHRTIRYAKDVVKALSLWPRRPWKPRVFKASGRSDCYSHSTRYFCEYLNHIIYTLITYLYLFIFSSHSHLFELFQYQNSITRDTVKPRSDAS